jgi:RNA-binding protein YlmH
LESCSHGDFLGAILGTGITREKVGDILLQVHTQIHVFCFLNDLIISYLFSLSFVMSISIFVRGNEVPRSLLTQNLLTI